MQVSERGLECVAYPNKTIKGAYARYAAKSVEYHVDAFGPTIPQAMGNLEGEFRGKDVTHLDTLMTRSTREKVGLRLKVALASLTSILSFQEHASWVVVLESPRDYR